MRAADDFAAIAARMREIAVAEEVAPQPLASRALLPRANYGETVLPKATSDAVQRAVADAGHTFNLTISTCGRADVEKAGPAIAEALRRASGIAGNAKFAKISPGLYDDLNFAASPIPVTYGTRRIKATLRDYRDFRSTKPE